MNKVILVNLETGESIEWDSIKTISSEDIESVKFDDYICEQTHDVSVDLEDLSEKDESEYNKPNPIYIPKHIAHRKKGRY